MDITHIAVALAFAFATLVACGSGDLTPASVSQQQTKTLLVWKHTWWHFDKIVTSKGTCVTSYDESLIDKVDLVVFTWPSATSVPRIRR